MATSTEQMPLREIVEEAGFTLILGAIGASAFYFLKGLRNSKGRRLAGGAQAVLTNAPHIGHWAAWLAAVEAIHCAMNHANQEEDPINALIAWGGANALCSMRRGPLAAVLSGLKGAAFGGVLGIAMYSLKHFMAED
ncbi:mitochondrial import inner membrane translocase subunit TIM17-2-like [Aegilops tauschii subsp. strangulata]|uniref:Mitochondrial import inner membrane translocase subunit Tim17 n=1 Tax=Aegilops tauschii TaxID=37682 RepID=M8B8P6_AEGTA|nr:mitochondrial import inner membrane translocase subunit TIM17-2-like [Aegilops tauschii subsp. strangulata]